MRHCQEEICLNYTIPAYMPLYPIYIFSMSKQGCEATRIKTFPLSIKHLLNSRFIITKFI
jgi:hypothetical protein